MFPQPLFYFRQRLVTLAQRWTQTQSPQPDQNTDKPTSATAVYVINKIIALMCEYRGLLGKLYSWPVGLFYYYQ